MTKHGDLDIALLPDRTRGYEGLRRAAAPDQVTDSVTTMVAALADVIRSKEVVTTTMNP